VAAIPSEQQPAVGELEIVRSVDQPVGGAANQQRVIRHAARIRAGELAKPIVNFRCFEVGRDHESARDSFDDERLRRWCGLRMRRRGEGCKQRQDGRETKHADASHYGFSLAGGAPEGVDG
jgi:hypothetical protein